MKNILITGVNSYIGNKFEEWVSQWPIQYNVSKNSLRNDDWKVMDWSIYDVVLHVAGIAHNSSDPKLKELYYSVNRDLTIEVAEKAKAEGVSQFIHMSSIIVFGTGTEVIDRNTTPNPDNFYGDSKLQSERGIEKLQDSQFNVTIIRPPMVYGKGSKGNYPRLAKLATTTPIFPDYNNRRSMIHIDNLTEFLKIVIDKEYFGVFHPQNKEYVSTSEMVKYISEYHDHKIIFLKLFNPIIILLKNFSVVKKVFGTLIYDSNLYDIDENYQVENFRETIYLTEQP